MTEEGFVDIKFRLPDGSDIGPFRFSPASTVQMLKERIITDWPKGNPTVPKLANEIKLISFGNFLENNKTVDQCKLPFDELADTIMVMHVVVRPLQAKTKTAVAEMQSMFLQQQEWLQDIEKKIFMRWDQHRANILEIQRQQADYFGSCLTTVELPAAGSSTSHVCRMDRWPEMMYTKMQSMFLQQQESLQDFEKKMFRDMDRYYSLVLELQWLDAYCEEAGRGYSSTRKFFLILLLLYRNLLQNTAAHDEKPAMMFAEMQSMFLKQRELLQDFQEDIFQHDAHIEMPCPHHPDNPP